MNEKIKKIIQTIKLDEVEFIHLIGSYARGNQTEFSDIDIKVALKDGFVGRFENKYIDGTYVSIKYDSKAEMAEYFTNPSKYIQAYPSVVEMIKLYDEQNYFEEFQTAFLQVDYQTEFQEQINSYVNKETIDWIEEVNKSFNGLLLQDNDKLLAGLHGLTYGMLHVLGVSEGIMYSNQGILHTFKKYFKNDERYRLVERAFGVKKHSLKTKTLKGLRLYLEIIDIIKYRFTEETNQQLIIVKKNIVKALHNY